MRSLIRSARLSTRLVPSLTFPTPRPLFIRASSFPLTPYLNLNLLISSRCPKFPTEIQFFHFCHCFQILTAHCCRFDVSRLFLQFLYTLSRISQVLSFRGDFVGEFGNNFILQRVAFRAIFLVLGSRVDFTGHFQRAQTKCRRCRD